MSCLPFNQSAERNREVIIRLIEDLIESSASILEVASGTGQHAHMFCQRNPKATWQTSDLSQDKLEDIEAWRHDLGQGNFLEPLIFDCTSLVPFKPGSFDMLVNINMIHISPWAACEGLMKTAAHCLKEKGILFLYGPYIRKDVVTAESNLEFDAWLRSMNPEFGIRNLEAVRELGDAHGLALERIESMPANNLSLVFRRI